MIIVQGNIAKTAETKLVTRKDGGKTTVTEFSVAENRGYGARQTTKFYKVSVWREHGENLAPHLVKGRPIYIVGEVDASAYINAEGVAVASLEIRHPTEIRLIGKKPTADAGEDEVVFGGEEVE